MKLGKGLTGMRQAAEQELADSAQSQWVRLTQGSPYAQMLTHATVQQGGREDRALNCIVLLAFHLAQTAAASLCPIRSCSELWHPPHSSETFSQASTVSSLQRPAFISL